MRTPIGQVNVPIERTLRLTTGLIMFSYAATHFLSHATGIFLLDTLESLGRGVLLAPWRTLPGRLLLLASVLIHGGLGLRALDRRRTLRMPASEGWQLALGLMIPLFLLPHVTDVRIGYSLYGFEDSYSRILYLFWLVDPRNALPRQFLLLLVVWIHGSIGIHMWLRYRPWYARRVALFAAGAVLIPVLAVIGIVNAGWNEILRARLEPGFAALHAPPAPDTPAGADLARLGDIWHALALAYIILVALILAHRLGRDWHERRARGVAIGYPGGRRVIVPRGFSILEASRWGRIPHASVCGGRGRCSTCRVRVLDGVDALALPNAAERATLDRIGAPPGVRLACQVRPDADVAVAALVAAGGHARQAIHFDAGRELGVTALFVDLRDSTRLAAERLPFDAIFIVDQYVRAVTGAIRARGGHVTSVAGDGVMSVFGLDGDAAAAALAALAAAEALWEAVDRLSVDLAQEIERALQFGIGVHSGVAVVGSVGSGHDASLHFLGDTGNVAARLEGLTKDFGCTMIVSEAAIAAAGVALADCPRAEVRIRGREGSTLPVVLVAERGSLATARIGAMSPVPRAEPVRPLDGATI